MYEHACVRVRQRRPQKRGRVWEMGGEFAEREVLEGVLDAVDGEGACACGYGDVTTHGGEDVGDAETGECRWVFGKGEVGDVETGHDFGCAGWTEGVGCLGDGGGGPLGGGRGGGGGDGHGWWWSVTGGEIETGSL